MRLLIPFLIFLFHLQIAISASLTSTTHHLCTSDTSLLLLQFKESTEIDDAASFVCKFNGQPSYPRTISWNRSTDCCTWDGVTCDEFTGEVIHLDLSCSQLQGVINSNSTLFQFSRLRSLNLAYNDFYPSLISQKFAGLQSLTHLNLSSSGFSGSLPYEFLRLFNLISLDLSSSSNGDIIIQPRIFELLLQNLTHLKEVSLAGVNIASLLPHNLSASLEVLNLGSTELFGEFPVEIFQLPNLQMLRLFNNGNLTGNLLKVEWNTSSALSYLDLSGIAFSGELPESIGNLKSLYHIDLSSCNFSGSIPESIGKLKSLYHLDLSSCHFSGSIPISLGHLKSLHYLDLSYCHLSGVIPESLGNLPRMTFLKLLRNNLTGHVPSSLANLEQLIQLDLSDNNFGGQLPNFFSNFKNLTDLYLRNNLFNGYFPSSIINLTKLEIIDLSNNSLTGPLPPNISGFPNLDFLSLGDNSFNSVIPSWVFNLPSLSWLAMTANQLTGQVYEFQCQSLQGIDLSGNKLHGPLPKSISELINLTSLDLSNNNFSGDVEISFFSNLKKLLYLDVSFNSLSLINNRVNSTLPPSLRYLHLSSCGVKDLNFLNEATILETLDLSNNKLHGKIFTEQKSYGWGQNLNHLNLSYNFLTNIIQLPSQSLYYLDLRSNLLTGPLIVPSLAINYYFASDNNFIGEIPSLICNLTSLVLLDLSNNNLSGAIPQCLGNLSMELLVLDLHMNNFHGIVPSIFSVGSKLRSLNLRDNLLEGTIPRTLSNCRELEVIDIGKNYLNGTFPWWLETLPKLQVLSLRANHLHGPLTISETRLSFPALRILDLSQNEFTGILQVRFLAQLKGLKIVNRIIDKLMFKELEFHYQDSVLLITKGQEIDVVNVLSVFTTIDLSSNKFRGAIPEVIGSLISLQGLNLSHNMLGGQIPPTLGHLTSLESLDLSSNQLEGEIPPQLTALTFLSVLNLSQNHLVGSIPRGQQFDTFYNTSYLGNDGLCGFPLSKTCGANNELVPPISTTPNLDAKDNYEDFMNGFTWQAVVIGYGSGMVIGVSMGCLSFITGKPKWFNKIIEERGQRLMEKKWHKDKWLSKQENQGLEGY